MVYWPGAVRTRVWPARAESRVGSPVSTRRGRPRIEASLSRVAATMMLSRPTARTTLGADLLVAAAEDVALAAYDCDDDPGVRAVDKVEDLALAGVGGEEPAVPHDVDAEQGGRRGQARP